jgi:hypothetical protein
VRENLLAFVQKNYHGENKAIETHLFFLFKYRLAKIVYSSNEIYITSVTVLLQFCPFLVIFQKLALSKCLAISRCGGGPYDDDCSFTPQFSFSCSPDILFTCSPPPAVASAAPAISVKVSSSLRVFRGKFPIQIAGDMTKTGKGEFR